MAKEKEEKKVCINPHNYASNTHKYFPYKFLTSIMWGAPGNYVEIVDSTRRIVHTGKAAIHHKYRDGEIFAALSWLLEHEFILYHKHILGWRGRVLVQLAPLPNTPSELGAEWLKRPRDGQGT